MGEAPELTDQEIEILKQLATGASNRQIAPRLHISANTVKVHLHNIYRKLGVESRIEATLLGLQAGLISGVGHVARPIVGSGDDRDGPCWYWWLAGW